MNRRVIYAVFFVMSLVFLGGCGGGGGSGSATTGTGTVSMDIADAKPFIDGEQPDELWVVFDDVLVHTSGGGWVSLNLAETPRFEINLLAFCDGLTTKLATPTLIPAGHVTQIRFEISRAYMVFKGVSPDPDEWVEIDLDVPSGTLRTDKQIDWTLSTGGAMSLTVHFDLSQSIVRSGPVDNPKYHLKPVVHLFNNDPDEAATICGSISADSFIDGDPVDVFVEWVESEFSEPQTYTHVTVPKEPNTDATDFCIYWLVPLDAGESYHITITNGFDSYFDIVPELASGVTVELNSTITIPTPPPPM